MRSPDFDVIKELYKLLKTCIWDGCYPKVDCRNLAGTLGVLTDETHYPYTLSVYLHTHKNIINSFVCA
jgi:hypothetical protein